MQHPAFNVHMIERQAAHFGHAESVPVHQEQKATVPLLVPAVLRRRVDQLADFEAGEVQPVGALPSCPGGDGVLLPARAGNRPLMRPASIPLFWSFPYLSHFVESSPCSMPLKPP